MSILKGDRVLVSFTIQDPKDYDWKPLDFLGTVEQVFPPLPGRDLATSYQVLLDEPVPGIPGTLKRLSAWQVEKLTDASQATCLQALNSARQVVKGLLAQTPTRGTVLTVSQGLCEMLRGLGMPQMAETLAAEVTELTQ